MKVQWLFDVDGTLTPPREKIDKEFERWFKNFMLNNSLFYHELMNFFPFCYYIYIKKFELNDN